jgi:hypothetical protein
MPDNVGGATTVGAELGFNAVIQLNGNPNGAFLGTARTTGKLGTLGGIFPLGQLAAQTGMILHELAHTLLAIPPDLGNSAQSEANTATVLGQCAAAILGAIGGS